MKIVEITCKKCKAKFETLESVPKNMLFCPSCQGKKLSFKTTEKEFEDGCGSGCSDCASCGQ